MNARFWTAALEDGPPQMAFACGCTGRTADSQFPRGADQRRESINFVAVDAGDVGSGLEPRTPTSLVVEYQIWVMNGDEAYFANAQNELISVLRSKRSELRQR